MEERTGFIQHPPSQRNESLRRTTLVSWMVGPSAIGSEKGTPSSIISDPPSCIASIIGTVSSTLGYPAVTKVTSAGLVCGIGQNDTLRQQVLQHTELFFSSKTFLMASIAVIEEGGEWRSQD